MPASIHLELTLRDHPRRGALVTRIGSHLSGKPSIVLEYYSLMPALNEDKTYSCDAKRPLCLWLAYPEDMLGGRVADDCAQMLSEEERARWKGLRFDEHRREYLTTRFLVRTALSHCHPLPAEAWKFQVNSYGKPAVHPDCGLRFNLSNSSGLVVCLIGNEGELGVDAEPCDRATKIAELGCEFLSTLELAQLEVLPDQDKLNRALTLWTLKEAYIKARGLGLSLPLKKFSFVFDESDGFRLETDPCLNDDPTRWRFCLLNWAGYRIALAVEGKTDPHLQVWEARPSVAAPVRQPSGGEKWFPVLNL